MRNLELKKLIKLFAKNEDMTMAEMESLVNSPFEFQAYIMKNLCDRDELKFPSLRIPNFGIFYCPDWKKEQFKKINNKKKVDNEDN